VIVPSPEEVGRYDSLFVSPRAGDALISCAARFHADRAKGLSVLVLSIFEGPPFRAPAGAPSLLGADALALDLPPAARRDKRHASFASSCFQTFPEDEAVRHRLTRTLADLAVRVRPRHVYAPLGVGSHVDHGIVCEAATLAFSGEAGRNVFLYEDRPEALVAGEVRLRLGLLGARLPAGALEAADRAGLFRHLTRHHRGAALRGEGGGPLDWAHAFRSGAARWRAARAWNPGKAFGPRLQPVVHVADTEAAAFARETAAALLPRSHGALARFASQAAAHTRRLGGGAHAERYWLLLPRLEGGPEPAPSPDVV
jgi:hypothetical protein